MTYDDIYPGTDMRDQSLFDTMEDPVRRWHRMVEKYSGLALTYASDRLPAIAAIVERETRLRQDDAYIAGMWRSSLLHDLAWVPIFSLFGARSPQNSCPTWAWPSVRAQVEWPSGPVESSLKVVNLSYTRLGPAHVGEVTNASITLEGHAYTMRMEKPYDPIYMSRDLEMVPRPPSGIGLQRLSVIKDYDWTTGCQPVVGGDTFIVLPIARRPSHVRPSFVGLILRKLTDGVFERMGIVRVAARHRSKRTTLGQIQILDNFLETLPIRQVTII
jgi:hypothetical protein